MTPKEKAEDLVDKYLLLPIDFPYTDTQDGQCISNGFMLYNSAKQCALIAVDEIIKTLPQSEYLEDRSEMIENRELIYWQQVKQEIEKL